MSHNEYTNTMDNIKKRAVTIKPRQRRLAQLMVENGRTNKVHHIGELVKQAGYGQAKVSSPSIITKSQGFLAALDELGLTDNFVVSSLVEDIRAKPQRRAFELSIAAKIRGLDRRADDGNSTGVQIANSLIIINAPKPLEDKG